MEEKSEAPKGACKHCCCAKAIVALLLFLVGGIIGYLMGQRCGFSKMQKMAAYCPMTAPTSSAQSK